MRDLLAPERSLIGVWWVFHFSSLFYSRLKFYCYFLFLPLRFSYELTLLFFFETVLFTMVTSCGHFGCTPSMHQVAKPLTIPRFLYSFASSDQFVVIVRTLCDFHSSSSQRWRFSFFFSKQCTTSPAFVHFSFFRSIYASPHDSIPTMYLYSTKRHFYRLCYKHYYRFYVLSTSPDFRIILHLLLRLYCDKICRHLQMHTLHHHHIIIGLPLLQSPLQPLSAYPKPILGMLRWQWAILAQNYRLEQDHICSTWE